VFARRPKSAGTIRVDNAATETLAQALRASRSKIYRRALIDILSALKGRNRVTGEYRFVTGLRHRAAAKQFRSKLVTEDVWLRAAVSAWTLSLDDAV